MSFRLTSLVAVWTILPLWASSALAQPPATEPAPKYTNFTIPADIQKTMDNISDLDVLKALVPIKLTGDQIKKLVTVMKESVTALEARRQEEFAAWRAVAGDVAKAHEEALKGVPVSAEVETRIVKVVSESEKRSVAARQDAINRIYAVARDVLTAEQKDVIEQQVVTMLGGKKLVPAKYRNNPSRAPKEEVQDLMLQVFVERIMLFDRTLILLGKIKPADQTGDAAPAPPAP